MKQIIKYTATGICTVFALVAGLWAFDNHYTPRAVTENMIAGVQQNQLQIQKNNEMARLNQWIMFLNIQIDRMTEECARNPHDAGKAAELHRLKTVS